jgi:hypothetical protein
VTSYAHSELCSLNNKTYKIKEDMTTVTSAALHVLSWQGVFLAPDFVSPSEVSILRNLGKHIRNVQPLTAQNRGNLTEAFFLDEYLPLQSSVPSFTAELESRITNITGIPYHRDETSLLFTSQKPLLNPPSSVAYLHHDKNGRERRTVTMLLYLTTTKKDEDGGHTIFPSLPRALADPMTSVSSLAEKTTEHDSSVGQKLPKGWRTPSNEIANIAKRLTRGFKKGHYSMTDGSYGNPRDIWDRTAFKMVQKECNLARSGRNHALAVKPKAGDAVFFWSSYPDGRSNPLMFHTACVAVSGGSREAIQKFKEPVRSGHLNDFKEAVGGGGVQSGEFVGNEL